MHKYVLNKGIALFFLLAALLSSGNVLHVHVYGHDHAHSQVERPVLYQYSHQEGAHYALSTNHTHRHNTTSVEIDATPLKAMPLTFVVAFLALWLFLNTALLLGSKSTPLWPKFLLFIRKGSSPPNVRGPPSLNI